MLRKNTTPEELAADWRRLSDGYSEEIWRLVQGLVVEHKALLATRFYDLMMSDGAASYFLSDQLVQTRLHAALQGWLTTVFSVAFNGEYLEAIAFQKRIGDVHARIGIPTYLVMRGRRALDHAIYDMMSDADPALRTSAVAYVSEVSSLAIEAMCQAYAVSRDRNARAEEAYRLFAMSQNIGAEKERQRAALLDWENQLMYEFTLNREAAQCPLLGKSDFGIWFLHKAAHAFDGSREVQVISEEIDTVDNALLALADVDRMEDVHIPVVREIRERCKTIGFLLDSLFEQAGHIESGRDVLTRLLNRKYLQVIMNREIEYARKSGNGFAVLVIDIDHFKRINDEYGHDGGDAALRHLGLFMSQVVRSGDYLFRLGGEEFLIVLVDVEYDTAMLVAENLRRRAESEAVPIGDDATPLHITISIGVALWHGHPDYMMLLKSADQALYRAKNNGRNRVEMGD